MNEKYLLSIKADEAPGLLNRVTNMLGRRRIELQSLTMARTDISTVVLISIEILIEPAQVKTLLLQIEKIIEVIKTVANPSKDVISQKLGFFKLANAILGTAQGVVIQQYGAQVISLYPDYFVVSKAGDDYVLNEMYQKLEGIHLLGFAQTGAIGDTPLLENDEWRISRLAA